MERTQRRAQGLAKWIIVGACVVGGLAVAGAAVVHFGSPRLVVSEAVEGPVVQAFYSTGTLQPDREFPIKSNTPGIVTEVKVDKGDAVKAGQLLAVVSAPELTYAAQKAAAELREKE